VVAGFKSASTGLTPYTSSTFLIRCEGMHEVGVRWQARDVLLDRLSNKAELATPN
jgi:hypothetical protein